MKNSTPNPWVVELPCPQCGAQVSLEETDRILSCAFCRVRLLTLYPDYPYYYLEPLQKGTLQRETVYLPYWRFRGLSFDPFRRSGRDRFLDASFLAVKIPDLPQTLGLQTRIFKLKVLLPGLKGRLLPFQTPFSEVLAQMAHQPMPIEEKEGPSHPQTLPPVFIGETVSRVYAPIYVQGKVIFDGLSDKPLRQLGEEDRHTLPLFGDAGPALQTIRFLPMLCPYCGSDLQGEKDTWVLVCRNCDRVWEEEGERLTSVDFGVWEKEGEDPPYYLPFWRIPIRSNGLSIQSRPPLSFASSGSPLFLAEKAEAERHLWLPAFKLSPSLFLIISRAVTTRQPADYRLHQTLPKGHYYPVNLPRREAAEGLLVLLADLQRSHIPSWAEVYPAGERPSALLVFIPFRLQGTELVQDRLSLGISRSALHFGRFL